MGHPMSKAAWFGGRLRELREGKGWTQAELAERAGLTREGIAQLETGRRKPAWETVIVVSEALGVDCRAFLEEPAERPEPHRGRPPKAQDPLMPSAPSRKRGRPRKGE